jgi:hypothetical protein
MLVPIRFVGRWKNVTGSYDRIERRIAAFFEYSYFKVLDVNIICASKCRCSVSNFVRQWQFWLSCSTYHSPIKFGDPSVIFVIDLQVEMRFV